MERGRPLGLFRSLAIGLFIFSIPLALLATNIRVAISEKAVYDYSVRSYDAAGVSGIPESELVRANGEIVRYLRGTTTGPLSIAVEDDNGQQVQLFNARETAHMADVRDLVQLLFAVQVLSVAVALTSAVVLLVLLPPRVLAAALLCGAVVTGGLLAIAGAVAVSGFDSAWNQFHLFAFSNDLWRLDPQEDHLIQMFPEPFWERITLLLGAATIFEAALISLVSGAYLWFRRPGEPEPIVKPTPLLAGPAGHSRPAVAPPNPRRIAR